MQAGVRHGKENHYNTFNYPQKPLEEFLVFFSLSSSFFSHSYFISFHLTMLNLNTYQTERIWEMDINLYQGPNPKPSKIKLASFSMKDDAQDGDEEVFDEENGVLCMRRSWKMGKKDGLKAHFINFFFI